MKVTGDCEEGNHQKWGVEENEKKYPTTFDTTVTIRIDIIGDLPPKRK